MLPARESPWFATTDLDGYSLFAYLAVMARPLAGVPVLSSVAGCDVIDICGYQYFMMRTIGIGLFRPTGIGRAKRTAVVDYCFELMTKIKNGYLCKIS
jgi:hypothetical protein